MVKDSGRGVLVGQHLTADSAADFEQQHEATRSRTGKKYAVACPFTIFHHRDIIDTNCTENNKR